MVNYHQLDFLEIETGFKHAQDRCLLFVDQSKQLLLNNSLNGSIILAVFALEELGRMVILYERCNEVKKTSKSFIRIKKRGQKGTLDDFYNHTIKQPKGLSILSKGIEILHQAPFNGNFFDPKCFDATDTAISQDLRERYTFVDYGDNGWIDPPKVNKNLLEKFIIEVETHCKKLSI